MASCHLLLSWWTSLGAGGSSASDRCAGRAEHANNGVYGLPQGYEWPYRLAGDRPPHHRTLGFRRRPRHLRFCTGAGRNARLRHYLYKPGIYGGTAWDQSSRDLLPRLDTLEASLPW